MSVESFIDTNVFIYHLEALDARKHAIAERIVSEGLARETACISFQVIQECLNTMLRKAEIRLDTSGTKAYLDTVLVPLCKVPSSAELYRQSVDIQAHFRFSFYDSLIVAAALEAGCTRLYSEDMQHGQKIGRLVINNPFKK